MERAAWLAERRAVVEADYTRDASTYDEGYDPVTPTHRSFVTRLLATVPSDGSLLDAPCGTGPYVGMVLEPVDDMSARISRRGCSTRPG